MTEQKTEITPTLEELEKNKQAMDAIIESLSFCEKMFAPSGFANRETHIGRTRVNEAHMWYVAARLLIIEEIRIIKTK